MAFRDIIFGRLELFFNMLKNPAIEIDLNSKLGMPPIGFDDVYIQGEFRGQLNGNAVGFGDLLIAAIAKSDVSGSTKVGDLVAVIVKKSSISAADLYEAKMRERTRIELRHQIASLATPPIDENDVLPTKKVTDYLPNTMVGRLRDSLNNVLRKYLIGGPISPGDLDGVVAAVNKNIVPRMLA